MAYQPQFSITAAINNLVATSQEIHCKIKKMAEASI